MTDYVNGFIGLVKAVTGIDRADAETIGFRRYACLGCAKRVTGWCSVCGAKVNRGQSRSDSND